MDDQTGFRTLLRMTAEEFNVLLGMVRPLITKQHTQMRRAISPRERLAVTMRFLATGGSAREIIDSANVILYLYIALYSVVTLFLLQVKRSVPSVSSTGLGSALYLGSLWKPVLLCTRS